MSIKFVVLLVLSAGLAIIGHYLAMDLLHWLFKPLTTLLLAAWVWRRPAGDAYRRWVLLGLLFSTAGDVFLMLPTDMFVQGLLSFLLAHITYLIAFRTRAPWAIVGWPFVFYAAVAAAVMSVLWPHLPTALRLPVSVYVLALAGMAAQAAAVWRQRRDRLTALAAAGAACFVLSDATLAWNRFVQPFELARLLVLLSYWLAQGLIACSTGPVPACEDKQSLERGP